MTVLQPKVVHLVNYSHRQNFITPPVTFETLLQVLGGESTTERDSGRCPLCKLILLSMGWADRSGVCGGAGDRAVQDQLRLLLQCKAHDGRFAERKSQPSS